MAALTKDRPGRVEIISRAKMPLGANVKAFKGAAAVVDTRAGSPTRGSYIPAIAAEGLVSRGRFRETVDNTGGANGARSVEVEFLRSFNVIWWDNSATTPVVAADRGALGYFEDDHTITSDDTDKSSAGRIFDINDSFVLVEVM